MEARRRDDAPCGAPRRASTAAAVWTAAAVRAAAAARVPSTAARVPSTAARVPSTAPAATTPTRLRTRGNERRGIRGEETTRGADERGQREEKQALYD